MTAELLNEDERLAISSLPSMSRQRQRTAEAIQAHVDAGAFTYTGLHQLREPWSSFAHEFFDGVTVNSEGIPTYYAADQFHPFEAGALVVGVNGRNVKVTRRRQVAVAGSLRKVWAFIAEDRGPWCVLEDTLPERLLRVTIWRGAWGLREDAAMASLVEWKWLQLNLSSAQPFEGAAELHAEIMERFGADPKFRAAAGLDAAPPAMSKPAGKAVRP